MYSRSVCPTLPLSQSPVDESPSLSSFSTRVWTSLRSSSLVSGDDDAGREETASASRRDARCEDDGDVDGEDEEGSDMAGRQRMQMVAVGRGGDQLDPPPPGRPRQRTKTRTAHIQSAQRRGYVTDITQSNQQERCTHQQSLSKSLS